MRRVHSPFVAEVLDADVTGKFPYIVTRYVPGHTLDDVVRQHGPLPPWALERLASGLAQALVAVHAAGVVHRDLKPGNVMLHDGNPVVIDFGIAHTGDATKLTQTGMFMGTPGYLAPRSSRASPAARRPTSIFSWGATSPSLPPAAAVGSGSSTPSFIASCRAAPTSRACPAARQLVSAALSRDPRSRPTAAWLGARARPRPGLLAPVLRGARTQAPGAPSPTGPRRPGRGLRRSRRLRAGVTAEPPATVRAVTAEPRARCGRSRRRRDPERGRGWAQRGHGRAPIRPAEYADLLPPVQVPACGRGPGPPRRGGAVRRRAGDRACALVGPRDASGAACSLHAAGRERRAGPAAGLVAAAVMVIAIAVSVTLPWAVRSGGARRHHAAAAGPGCSRARRPASRSVRGPSVARFSWSGVGQCPGGHRAPAADLGCLLVAALFAAGAVFVVTIVLHLDELGGDGRGYAACAAAACYGREVAAPRRQLNRLSAPWRGRGDRLPC